MIGKKRILVTGCSGFLGSWLVADLQDAGHIVFGIDRVACNANSSENYKFLKHDLRQPIPKFVPEFDICIHLASAAGGFLQNYQDQSLLESELQMLKELRNICNRGGCDRIIFTSSTNVFEVSGVQSEGPLTLSDQRTPYAKSKAECERFIQSEFKNFSILRPTNYFGPNQPKQARAYGESHVIPDLIEKIKQQKILEVFGDGKQIRNFIHLSDLSDFILRAIAAEELRFAHLRSDLFLSIGELALQLMDFLESPKNICYFPQYLEFEPAPISGFDLNAALQLQWAPQVQSLREGLERNRRSPTPTAAKANEIHKLKFSNGVSVDFA